MNFVHGERDKCALQMQRNLACGAWVPLRGVCEMRQGNGVKWGQDRERICAKAEKQISIIFPAG